MRLYWVRHGQMEGRAHARSDLAAIDQVMTQEVQGGLSELGRSQAAAVAEHFVAHPVDALYASPLARAHQTGEVTAAALDMPLAIRPQIRELVTGRLPTGSRRARVVQGLARAPFPSKRLKRMTLGGVLIPLYFRSWQSGRTEGGESPAELDVRIHQMLTELNETHAPDAEVALFAHGYLIFLLSQRAAGRHQLTRFKVARRAYIQNGAITTMELDRAGHLRLVSFAEAGHLEGAAA